MKTYLLLISLLITGLLSAQSEECGTVVTQEQLNHLNETYASAKDWSTFKSMEVINVPIVNHIVRMSDGTGGLTTEDVAAAMGELNTFYAQADIQFFECEPTKFIDDTDLFDLDYPEEDWIYEVNYNVDNVLNIYYVNDMVDTDSGRQFCGYAFLPPGPDRIMMRNSCVFNGSTLIHELGHYFSLLHTHGSNPRCGGTTELVNGSNCTTGGDRICDTPADPNLALQDGDCATPSYLVDENCEYTGTLTDDNGDSYNPFTNNIMSYSRKQCRDAMTEGQFEIVRYSIVNQRNYLNGDCQIQCTQGASCDDNDPCTIDDVYDENCLCSGTFADTDGDGTCDGEDSCPDLDDSLIGTACNDENICTTGDVYTNDCECIGTFADADGDGICDAEDDCPNDPDDTCVFPEYCELQATDTGYEFIQSVELNGQSNDSGNNGGYGDFTGTTLTTLGSTNTITLTPGFAGDAYPEDWIVWIDFNRDGDYNDAGEEVFSGRTEDANSLTGTFAAPSGTGTTLMRIAMRYNRASPLCGTFQYGEVEDYIVELTDGAACTPGNSCDDGDDCTINDTYTADCECEGTFADADDDGVCDAEDPCPNNPDSSCVALQYCESEGASTNYEYIQSVELNGQNNNSGYNEGYADFTATILTTLSNTNSIVLTPGFGAVTHDESWVVWIDFNKDGDFTDAGEEVFSGESLDGTPLTGTFTAPIGTGTTVMRIGMRRGVMPGPCSIFLYGEVEDYTVELTDAACTPGTTCDDANVCTVNDTYTADCECVGTFADADNDTVCDAEDVCPDFDDLLIGTTCDDTNACTINDTYTADCECVGTFADADNDTVCDSEDVCPDFDDLLIGTTCDDGSDCTVDDVYTADCECVGTFADSDGDGVCDAEDTCPDDPLNNCNEITYCEAQGTDTGYEFIQSVEIGGLVNESGNNNGYAAFPDITFPAATGPRSITLTPGFDDSPYNENWSVWIDANEDGDFDDPGELVFSGESEGNTPLTGQVTMPAVLDGTTTLRVVMEYNYTPAPCGSFQYGEVEDYLVFVDNTSDKLATENQLIQVYPNPTEGLINIDLHDIIHTSSIETVTATVYTMDGKRVHEEKMNARSTITIDTHDLPDASYILRLRTDDGKTFNGKFVKL